MAFLSTLLIATIPATVTSLISFLVAINNSNNQIKSIKEQNKADIEKIIEQNKLEIERTELGHKHQIELLQKQLEIDMKKSSNDGSNKLAQDFMEGKLDLSNLSKHLKGLGELQKDIEMLKK